MRALLLVWLTAAPPDWLKSGGSSARFPAQTHLTGFAAVERADAFDSAKAQAAADLASRVSLRIQSQISDVQAEKDGQQSYAVAAMTRASSDVHLSGVSFETAADGGKSYAFAVIEKSRVVGAERAARDEAFTGAKQALQGGARAEADKREAQALQSYFRARVLSAEALDHHAILRAVSGAAEAFSGAAELSQEASERITALLSRPVSSMKELADALAFQLVEQNIAKADSWTFGPLTYAASSYSSVFGRQVALDLDSALTAKAKPGSGTRRVLVGRGSYLESDKTLRVIMIVRIAESGQSVASAEASIPRSALGADVPFVPQNLAQARLDQKLLGADEEVSGSLRVELWTNKGRDALVFGNKEELKIFVRVNRPAYVRLVYLLAKGDLKVPLAQAYYIDESKVNKAVEYPDVFEVSAPFGVERLYAVAFTEKPEPLPVQKVVVDGEPFDVVQNAAANLVRHRGIKKKQGNAETAEAVVTLTTTPR